MGIFLGLILDWIPYQSSGVLNVSKLIVLDFLNPLESWIDAFECVQVWLRSILEIVILVFGRASALSVLLQYRANIGKSCDLGPLRSTRWSPSVMTCHRFRPVAEPANPCSYEGLVLIIRCWHLKRLLIVIILWDLISPISFCQLLLLGPQKLLMVLHLDIHIPLIYVLYLAHSNSPQSAGLSHRWL